MIGNYNLGGRERNLNLVLEIKLLTNDLGISASTVNTVWERLSANVLSSLDSLTFSRTDSKGPVSRRCPLPVVLVRIILCCARAARAVCTVCARIVD